MCLYVDCWIRWVFNSSKRLFFFGFTSFKATKQEIVDLQEEHVKERQELEQTQMELTRELKLKVLIIENFIPPEEKSKVRIRTREDQEKFFSALKVP